MSCLMIGKNVNIILFKNIKLDSGKYKFTSNAIYGVEKMNGMNSALAKT